MKSTGAKRSGGTLCFQCTSRLRRSYWVAQRFTAATLIYWTNQESAPEGRPDNSPALQRWEKREKGPSPGGTTEVLTQLTASSAPEATGGRNSLTEPAAPSSPDTVPPRPGKPPTHPQHSPATPGLRSQTPGHSPHRALPTRAPPTSSRPESSTGSRDAPTHPDEVRGWHPSDVVRRSFLLRDKSPSRYSDARSKATHLHLPTVIAGTTPGSPRA